MICDERIKRFLSYPQDVCRSDIVELVKEVAEYRGLKKEIALYSKKPTLEEIKAKITDWRKDSADIMPIEKFLDYVEGGYIAACDGAGDYIDDEANDIGEVYCHPSLIKDKINAGIHYVLWYNK